MIAADVDLRSMVLPPHAQRLAGVAATPAALAMAWSRSEPLMALIAAGSNPLWSRFSVLAPATGERLVLDSDDALAQLDTALPTDGPPSLLPGWIGYLSYELGGLFEPTARSRSCGNWPLADLTWCDRALVHDAEDDSWWSIGGCTPPEGGCLAGPMDCGPLCEGDAAAFESAVAAAIEYIHAGDVFQANITRRCCGSVEGDLRSAALAALGARGGWFGALMEFPPHRALLSLSPELFLAYDASTRMVRTRPMKGTRPDSCSEEELLDSPKDAAELHMIVDLVRNDLGRVCEYGSVQVNDARRIEHHPTVLQCVGEVEGRLREEASLVDLLAATFPPGSVTGAPKIRAMQIIDELEEGPRGPYCGAMGILGRSMVLSVAIRTAAFDGSLENGHFRGEMVYGTGCGIVADSVPREELRESEVKTRVLKQTLSLRQQRETARAAAPPLPA